MFISSLTLPDVVVIDAATRKEVKRIPVGKGSRIQMQPDGKRVFVFTPDQLCRGIDTATMTVTGHIDAGRRQPDGMVGPRGSNYS